MSERFTITVYEQAEFRVRTSDLSARLLALKASKRLIDEGFMDVITVEDIPALDTSSDATMPPAIQAIVLSGEIVVYGNRVTLMEIDDV